MNEQDKKAKAFLLKTAKIRIVPGVTAYTGRKPYPMKGTLEEYNEECEEVLASNVQRLMNDLADAVFALRQHRELMQLEKEPSISLTIPLPPKK